MKREWAAKKPALRVTLAGMSNKVIEPPSEDRHRNRAVEVVRAKVSRAYGEEPSAVAVMAEAAAPKEPSKHQLFMKELSGSGMSLAEIQTAWHKYYDGLDETEKKEVWQEFYDANQHTPYQKLFQKQVPVASRKRLTPPLETTAITTTSGVTIGAVSTPAEKPYRPKRESKLGRAIRQNTTYQKIALSPTAQAAKKAKDAVQRKVSANGRLRLKHHLQSLLFGLSMGLIVVVVLLFSFFNEYIIAPFIQPSRTASAAPVIVSNLTASQAATPTVIVPKINIQIPIDFNLQSIDEKDIQNSLANGVIHYPSTVLPGQNGNAAFFGHSSSNIFNNGKYKFAFVLLHELTTGDVFYITYNGKVYAYQVFAREIVPPTQVSVLNDTKGKQATAVLITCDPPGFSTNRLVVWGEQISPSITSNTAPTPSSQLAPEVITSNGPTLWTRLWRSVFGG